MTDAPKKSRASSVSNGLTKQTSKLFGREREKVTRNPSHTINPCEKRVKCLKEKSASEKKLSRSFGFNTARDTKEKINKKINDLLEKGERAQNREYFEKAIRCYDKAIALNPKQTDAWIKKGFAFYRFDKNTVALECYDIALQHEPNNALTWNNKGGVYISLENFEEALVCFEKATQFKENYSVAWNNKGVALRNMGKLKEAISCHARALQIDPNYKQAWNNLARARQAAGELEEAVVCFDRAITLDSKYYQAWHGKGMVLQEQGHQELAMKCFEKVLVLNANYEEAWISVPIVPVCEVTPPIKKRKRSVTVQDIPKLKQILVETSSEPKIDFSAVEKTLLS